MKSGKGELFDNIAFWNQQSPWYYTNYETSSWKRIVRSKHFISFFKEIHVSHLDIHSSLEKKISEFFYQNENKVINRNDRQWSHRKLMIFCDLLSENGEYGIADMKMLHFEKKGLWIKRRNLYWTGDNLERNKILWPKSQSQSFKELARGTEEKI